MNRIILLPTALLLAVLPARSSGESNNDNIAPPITIYTQFEKDYSVLSAEEMKAELSAIMAPIGLHFEWRSLQANRGNEVAVDLVVVTFKGSCKADDLFAPRVNSGALGWTHMTDGEVLPFSGVHCDRIRKLIRRQLVPLEPEARAKTFGRAMGRVLAHELYHIFANTARHASWGVAKALYTPAELVSDTFLFQQRESKNLREGKLKPLLRSRRAGPAAFTSAGR